MASSEPAVKEPLSRQKHERPAATAEEPTKAEIMDDIRIGLKQAAAGEGRPAREAFQELRRKIKADAHSR